MSKTFLKLKRWISGLAAVLLLTTVIMPGVSTANGTLNTITVAKKITNDPTPALQGTISSATALVEVTVDTLSYDATNNGDGTWVLADNVITVPLADGVYDVVAETDTGVTDSTVGELAIDTIRPELDSVYIYSNNTKNTSWAKPGDTLYLLIQGSEILDKVSLASSRILGSYVTAVDDMGSDKYRLSRKLSSSDLEGKVTFEVSYSDLAGNTGLSVGETTGGERVDYDKTAPRLYSEADYQKSLEPTVAGTGQPNNYILDQGVYTKDEHRVVDVATDWKIVSRKGAGEVVYEVTYQASDQAGNQSVIVKVKAELGKSEVTKSGSWPVALNGFESGNVVERSAVYHDAGARLDWSTSGDEAIHLWTAGDLDVTTIGHYQLGYMAEIPATLAGTTVSSVKTKTMNQEYREIEVQDTTAPMAPKGLKAVGGTGYIQLSWTNPTAEDFAGLDIYRSTSKGAKGKKIAGALSPETNIYDDYDVEAGVVYYYTLVAYDRYGNDVVSTQTYAKSKALKIVSTEATTVEYVDNNEVAPADEEDVKSGDTDENKNENNETKTDSEVPLVGIIILFLLVALGIYLLYLQNPDMFKKLAFWKKPGKK